jgi:hypothetical protein
MRFINFSLWESFIFHLVWSSSWFWTLFFNPTQLDEQDPKPSPRIRAPELAQGLGSDRIACSAQPVGQIWPFNPRVGHPTRDFCMGRNSGWVPDGQVCLSDSTRRTRRCVRFNPSDKNPNPINPLEQKGYVQPCPNLELNARARVQLNSTITLLSLDDVINFSLWSEASHHYSTLWWNMIVNKPHVSNFVSGFISGHASVYTPGHVLTHFTWQLIWSRFRDSNLSIFFKNILISSILNYLRLTRDEKRFDN